MRADGLNSVANLPTPIMHPHCPFNTDVRSTQMSINATQRSAAKQQVMIVRLIRKSANVLSNTSCCICAEDKRAKCSNDMRKGTFAPLVHFMIGLTRDNTLYTGNCALLVLYKSSSLTFKSESSNDKMSSDSSSSDCSSSPCMDVRMAESHISLFRSAPSKSINHVDPSKECHRRRMDKHFHT